MINLKEVHKHMTTEKKSRRTADEILSLVDKAEKLIANGTPKTKAAEEVGLGYPVLMRHLGDGVKSKGDTVKVLVDKLILAIRTETKKEILASLR